MRDQAILLLMPNMNPDGLDIVRDWYMKNLGTPFETTATPMLYHHYIGHDNNRDWYMFTQVESQAVARQLYHEWFPQIVYNHHQSSPFPGRIWGPPMKNPVNPNLDPLIVSTINQIGEHMRKRFDEEEKPGYNSGIQFDMWWNGSMRGAPDFHNMAGFLTETALYRYATPKCYTPEEVPDTFGERHGNMPAKTSEHELHESVARRLLAAASAGGVHADVVARDARSRREAEGRLPVQHLAHGHASDRARRAGEGRSVRLCDRSRGAARSDAHRRTAAHVPDGRRRDPPRGRGVHRRRTRSIRRART